MTHPKLLRTLLVPVAGCLAPAWIAAAQQEPAAPTPPPATPATPVAAEPAAPAAPATPEPSADTLLSPQAFTSEIAGVSFRPPTGWKRTDKPGDEEIAVYTNDKKWALRVTRAALDHPLPLVAPPAQANAPAGSKGMMDVIIDNFKKTSPDAQILRNEVINVGEHFVGVVVARYTLNGQQWLRQQAMVQASEEGGGHNGGPIGEVGGRLYYVFNLVTPAGAEDDDRLAAATFSAVVDSVQLLDRTKIREDQVQRLFRTRALFTYWNHQRFQQIAVPKQYFRILKDGHDVGYTFSEELLDRPNLAGISDPGVIAYERTHLEESDELGHARRTDAGLFKYASFDRGHERWTRSVVLQATTQSGHPYETYATEFGESLREMRRVFAKEQDGGVIDPSDPKAPPAKMVEVHSLDVTIAGKDQNAEPVHKELPGWYLPQSMWHFLPRLVVDEKAFPQPRTYLFAVYNNERREVMSLYVDKSTQDDVAFNGHKVRAVTVTERLGLGGNPIVHYLTPEGQYLGSEDKAQHLLTIASTESEVLKLWPKANLTRPEPMQAPGKGNSATGAAVTDPTSQQQEPAPNRQLPPALR